MTETRKARPRRLLYVHFTDEAGALGVSQSKTLRASSIVSGVYAVAVGGANVPGTQKTTLGRAKHRGIAIVFTTDRLPDVAFPEEVIWHVKELVLRTVKIMPAAAADKLLDASKVVRVPHQPWRDTVRLESRLVQARDLFSPVAIDWMPALAERIDVLGTDIIGKLRKDFLVLIGNTKRIKTYDDAEEVRVAFRRWRERYDDLGAQIRKDLESRGKDDADAKRLVGAMRPFWDLSFEMGSMPLRSYDPSIEQWWPKASIFRKYQEEARLWDQRIRKKAPAAWKWLESAAGWAADAGIGGGGGRPVLLRTAETENITVEGFKVQLYGFEPGDGRLDFDAMREALRLYKSRASKVLPWLLEKQLPLVFTAAEKDSGGDAAATYRYDHIEVTFWGHPGKNIKQFVHYMAHEMGHHLYKNGLSGQAQEAWSEFIRGGRITVNLRDLLPKLRGLGDSVFDADDKLRAQDPILYLQLDGLVHDIAYKDLDLFSIKSIIAYLDGGGDPLFVVNRRPITGYAAKNAEEAFCETVGLLVAYGPQAVLDDVRGFLASIVPGARVESRQRFVALRALFVA